MASAPLQKKAKKTRHSFGQMIPCFCFCNYRHEKNENLLTLNTETETAESTVHWPPVVLSALGL